MTSLKTQITQAIEKWPKPSPQRKALVKSYMAKNAPTKFDFYGLRIPVVRETFKNLKVQQYSLKEQTQTFFNLWKSAQYFEEALLALYWIDQLHDKDLIQLAPQILKMSSRIDNWAHADQYCSTLARLYELAPQKLEPTYKKWEQSSNPWLNRISMIGLFYYNRLRQQKPTFLRVAKTVEKFFDHEHYYVGKAVGWTIREIYNAYPDPGLKFIFKHAHRVHPSGWYAVTEKLKQSHKAKALQLRKAKRN